jgi:predicted MFS family arabinose efflux permease
VLIVTDIARTGLVALMAIPGMPFAALCGLLVLVQLLNAPFSAARAATLAAALSGDRYVVASGAHNMVVQLAQVVGFAAGGTLVAGLGVGPALLLDAATFLASASLVRFGVADRLAPARQEASAKPPSWWRSTIAGSRVVWTDRRLRALVWLACVAGFYVTVEGLAVPYAREIGAGPIAVGALLAASPAGTVVGMWVLSRVRPATRLRLLGPLAALACAPLVACAVRPGVAITVLLWATSGAASGYHMVASAAFVQAVPDAGRGQAFGLASTALKTSQGAGILLAGALSEQFRTSAVVASAGALGVLAATTAAVAWTRANAHYQRPEESPFRPPRTRSAANE